MCELLKDKSKYTNRILHSDIEARGFLDVIKTAEDVWCIVSRDDETDEVFLFHDYPEYDNTKVMDLGVEYTIPTRNGALIDGVRFWYLAGKNGSKLAVHNCFTYDKPLINKIWPKCEIEDDVWIDTFIQSKLQWFDRPQRKGAKSAHGLLNYSLMEGNKKPEVEDFTVMNAFMVHRCIVDTKTQRYAGRYLNREAAMCKDKLGIDFTEAYKMEVEYTKTCHNQEVYGALVDQDHIHKCIIDLDEKTKTLADEVEPMLPPSLKVGTARVTRSDLMRALGHAEEKIPEDEYETVKKDGSMVHQPVKPYYKPSVNYHRLDKTSQYSGFNISYGETPNFVKKKELTDWIKLNHADTKTSDWDIEKKVIECKVLNKNTCEYFGVEETDTQIISGPHTRLSFSPSTISQHEVTKAFLIKAGITWAEEWNLKRDQFGQIMKAEYNTEARYPKKAAPENQMVLKIKKGEALVTSPKFGENEYKQLTTDLGKKVGLYNTLIHRRRFLSNPKDGENKGLLAHIREDGRVPAGVNNFATSTGRGAHRVIVNLPADGVVYGKEMRSCIIAAEGKELVGIDQKSSQLSICAFITNNTSYYNAVATGVEFENKPDGSVYFHGTSAHCVNSRYFNLVTKEQWEDAVLTQHEELIHTIVLSRKKSKSLSFASLFGAGAKKLAVMGGFPEAEAKEKLQAFLDNMGLSDVMRFLEQCKIKYARGSGFYIPSGFGYWIYCNSIHKSNNYIIQNLESVIQRRAIYHMEQEISKRGWRNQVNKILDIHDEVLFEVDKGMGAEVGQMACDAYTQAGIDLHNFYKSNLDIYPAGGTPEITCDFAGGYAVGQSYAECH